MNKQNLIACLLLSAYTIHSALDAGIFIPLTIISSSSSAGGEGGAEADVHFFPGGTFVYKFMTKDYFASYGTLRVIVSDLAALSSVENETTVVREGQQLPRDDDDSLYDDRMYTIYMDDATLVPGGKTRFASGILLPTETNDSSSVTAVKLLSMNERIAATAAEQTMKNNGDGATMSKNVQYQIGTLPSQIQVKEGMAVATHRFTGGVWSALLQTYKIIPKLKTYYQEYSSSSSSADGGEEEERNLIVITKCSVSQKICTYYVPLNNVTLFYINHITTEEYVTEFKSSHDDGGMLTRMGSMFNQLNNTILGDGKELSSSLPSTTSESLGFGNGSSSEL